MEQHVWEIVSGLLLLSNIPWFMYYRSEQKKKGAEANRATTEAEQVKIDLQQDQYDYLLSKLTYFQKEYVGLQTLLNTTTDSYTQELIALKVEFSGKINEKCNEIAGLKSKISYYRGLRCYKSDCSIRISTRDKDDTHDTKTD